MSSPRGCWRCLDVDGGPTDEQLAVLEAFVTHVWKRPDLDLATLTPLARREVADRLPRRRSAAAVLRDGR